MKIVIANRRYFESTGPERYLFGIKERFEQDGHEVLPFSVRYSMNRETPYAKYFVSPPGDEETLYFKDYNKKLSLTAKLGILANSIYSIEARRNLGKLLDDHGADLVYLLGIATSISPSVIDAAKSRGIPVILRASDFFIFCAEYTFMRNRATCRECETSGHIRALRYRCLQDSLSVTGARVLALYIHQWLGIYKKLDGVIAPSLCMREAFLKAGFPGEKVHHIPSFFNAPSVQPCYENDGYIIYFGRIDMDKGVENLIRAYEIGGFRAPLYIVGNSSDGEDIRLMDYVREKKILNISFLGFREKKELLPLVQRAMFSVVPSVWPDNSPNSVLEAMACGKPVIGSDTGGISEQITPECGILVPPCDPKALALAIDSLLSDPEKVISMGKNGRHRVEHEYTIENHYNMLLSVFKKLVNVD